MNLIPRLNQGNYSTYNALFINSYFDFVQAFVNVFVVYYRYVICMQALLFFHICEFARKFIWVCANSRDQVGVFDDT